jgi:hypothetical protein
MVGDEIWVEEAGGRVCPVKFKHKLVKQKPVNIVNASQFCAAAALSVLAVAKVYWLAIARFAESAKLERFENNSDGKTVEMWFLRQRLYVPQQEHL